MRILATAACAALCAAPGIAQFAATGPGARAPAKGGTSVLPPPSGGGFLIGADDCAGPHTPAGTGPVAGVPFDLSTATTGATQPGSVCLFFGLTDITFDVWYDWTASAAGQARLFTCSQTGVDTKVALWEFAGSSSCPLTPIACNDDACGLQSSVLWPVTAGSTYTIQLGTFPGAAAGSGNFSIEELVPLPCGQYDDGSTESALGLTAGGEIMWLHAFDCGSTVLEVSTAYGTLMFPGAVTNGSGSRIAVYEDLDCDGNPTTGLVLRSVVSTVIVNGDTDMLNPIVFPPTYVGSGCSFAAATADQASGEFPGPMDQQNPVPQAWVAGHTAGPGSMDLQDLNANAVPPLQLQAIGFPSAWLLRAELRQEPGSPFCFGDATPITCPCTNVPAPGAGCGNGTFPEGALLWATGTSSPDTVALHVDRATPLQPGLFFQGDLAINGGQGMQFGDGLRCAGVGTVRLEIVTADAAGRASSSVAIALAGGVSPGDTKHYQYWYRDPVLSPCGFFFNLTNGYTITW